MGEKGEQTIEPVFEWTRADDPDLAPLFEASDAYSASRYPSEGRFAVPASSLASEGVHFAVARLEGRPVGCGGVVLGREGHAEIKRLIVLHALRGRGIGSGLLARLEEAARNSGAQWAFLETGPLNIEAIALYRRSGYEECGHFGPYCPNQFSLFFRKQLRDWT